MNKVEEQDLLLVASLQLGRISALTKLLVIIGSMSFSKESFFTKYSGSMISPLIAVWASKRALLNIDL